jgi:hypothetical protein
VLCALTLAACFCPLHATTLEYLSLSDMTAKSTAIVRGSVVSSYAAFTGPVIYTHYQIRVMESYKGSFQTSVDVVFPGGVVNGRRQSFSGVPQLPTGSQYVFFLWTGSSGLTQIMGLTQGLFAISSSDANAPDPTVTRSASEEMMLEPGTGKTVQDKTVVMRLSELKARISAGAPGARR